MTATQTSLFDSTPGRWLAYTDGSCKPTNPGPSAWGAVIIAPDGTEDRCKGFIGHGTNQIAEITAAIEGLTRTPAGATVTLLSDSQYVLKGLTEWRAGWIRRGWKTAAGEPVANKNLWQRLYALFDARKVTTQWVRGHNGDKYNEMADKLALAAQAEALARQAS